MPTGGLVSGMQPTQVIPGGMMNNGNMFLTLSKEQKQNDEFTKLLSTYNSAIDAQSDQNQFRECLYNKFDTTGLSRD